jgi:hypothetical protein
MKRTIPALVLFAAVAAFLFGQRDRNALEPSTTGFEVRSLFPREVSPAQYQQVDQREVQLLGTQGWELVSVMPYVYRNEERGPELHGPKPMVTQTYPAYFFKRVRVPARREDRNQ